MCWVVSVRGIVSPPPMYRCFCCVTQRQKVGRSPGSGDIGTVLVVVLHGPWCVASVSWVQQPCSSYSNKQEMVIEGWVIAQKFLQVISEVVTLDVGFHGVLTGEGLFGVSFVPRGECRAKFVLLGWFMW